MALSIAEPPPEVDPFHVRLLYTPHAPTAPQHSFLLLGNLGIREALYGGAAGGGKSDALLMDALRYVDVPGYSAILFRRTYEDLNLPDALIPRSKAWLLGTDATWNEQSHRWTFPAGATLSFGYLQHRDDRYRYQGAAFQFVGFDELTQFTLEEYLYLFTRLRRPSGLVDNQPLAKVPLRMRGASNPGGRGHKWVKRRYIDRLPNEDDPKDTPAKAAARIFIPARLSDNPHLDAEEYARNLEEVDPETRAQLLEGDWDAGETGDVFALYKHGDYRLATARQLGRDLDAMLDAGTIPPPAGGMLDLGLDWGERTGYSIGWPLEGGGTYVVEGGELEHHEAGDAFRVIIDDVLASFVERHAEALGLRPPVPRAGAITRRLPIEPLDVLSEVRYDAAGIASQRTFTKLARRRRPRLKVAGVSFGAPAPGRSDRTSYKRETIGYMRRLAKRTNDGPYRDEDGILQLSGRLAYGKGADDVARQAVGRRWKDPDLGILEKGDDHGFDSTIAMLAPVAVRWRG